MQLNRLVHATAIASATSALTGSVQAQHLDIELVTDGLDRPLFVTHVPGDDSRIFIVEQWGDVRIYDFALELLLPTPYVTIDVAIDHLERGLLGMAIDPNYEDNGYVYFNYTSETKTVIERYTTSVDDRNLADPASAVTVICIDQPQALHNAGWTGFGLDGYLYSAIGDGGPPIWSQDLMSLLGKIIRIDVSQLPYQSPPDNPFVDDPEAMDEIWASGLRNPFRCSFDRLTGDFWVGDVGQNALEELSYVAASPVGGANFGWPCYEADTPYWDCEAPDAVPPAIVYDHSAPPGSNQANCAVIGGYVYRGTDIPSLYGKYVYSDHCSSRLWSVRHTGGEVSDVVDHAEVDIPDLLMSFGEDARGELYVCTRFAGHVYRIIQDPDTPVCPSDINNDGSVGVFDLVAVITSWGRCNATWCAADIDGDGFVSTTDLIAVILSWGPCS
ncbi:MAG: PQQ-dependent sugar dehydrogenase [Planctomycetota bacterium]|jgi:glucose/arabinose dehydrogenase